MLSRIMNPILPPQLLSQRKNKSLSYIAAKLKWSKRTINYELKRCKSYNALLAQVDYDAKRESYGCRQSVNQEDGDYILSKLKLGCSLESIGAPIEKEPNSAG